MSITVKYGLRHKKTGELLKVSLTSNGEDYEGVSISHTLSDYGKDWLVDKMFTAEYVRRNSTEYYNAEYETPKHSFKMDDLEVVKVGIIVDIVPMEVKFPTAEEFSGNTLYDYQYHGFDK